MDCMQRLTVFFLFTLLLLCSEVSPGPEPSTTHPTSKQEKKDTANDLIWDPLAFPLEDEQFLAMPDYEALEPEALVLDQQPQEDESFHFSSSVAQMDPFLVELAIKHAPKKIKK